MSAIESPLADSIYDTVILLTIELFVRKSLQIAGMRNIEM